MSAYMFLHLLAFVIFFLSYKQDIISCHQGQRLLSNFTCVDCQKRCFSTDWFTASLSLMLCHKCDVYGRRLLCVHDCSCICMDHCAFMSVNMVQEDAEGKMRGVECGNMVTEFHKTNTKGQAGCAVAR